MNRPNVGWPGGCRTAVVVSVLFETWSDKKVAELFRAHDAAQARLDRPWRNPMGPVRRQGRRSGGSSARSIAATCAARSSAAADRRNSIPTCSSISPSPATSSKGHGYVQDQVFLEMPPEEQQSACAKCSTCSKTHRAPSGGLGDADLRLGRQDLCAARRRKASSGTPTRSTSACRARRRRQPARSSRCRGPTSSTTGCCVRARATIYDVYVDTFDYLHNHEPGGLINIAIHSHFGGRPLIIAQFLKLLRYFSSFDGVWFPSHRELVQWFLDQDVDELRLQVALLSRVTVDRARSA